MRIYQPKNELGQSLLNEGQLVATSKSITKNLVDGSITLTEADVSGISNWDVKNVEMIIDGHTVAFTAGVEKTDDGIVIHFADANEASKLDFTSAKITLQLIDSQGFTLGGGNNPVEAIIDVLILQAKEGDVDSAKKAIRMLSEKKEYEQIKTFGNELKATGIDAYKYADLVNGEYKFKEDSSLTEWDYVLPNLEYSYYMFMNGPIESWDIELPSLTAGVEMFSYCNTLTSFTSDLPKLTNGESMFHNCSNLSSFTSELPSLERGNDMFSYCHLTTFTSNLPKLESGSGMFLCCFNLSSFTSELPSLTSGYGMFDSCQLDQASVDHILATIKDWSAEGGSHELTLGVAAGVNKRVAEFAAKGWTVK